MTEHAFLPSDFLERMKTMLGDEFEDFVKSYDKPHHQGLRYNTLKVAPEFFEKLAPTSIEKVPWIDNGFYYDGTEQPAKHPYYYAGLYYIQEPSAMTPASLLPVKPGDKVLDLCAAPGGKSTELAARLEGRGVLVANDISNSRAKALLKNIELFGARNAIVVSEPPQKLTERFEGYFDRILVDAPCSGEGMFRKSHAIIKNWEQYGVDYYAKLQREILPCAVDMLKPGGYMIYSTCTFSPTENEGTLKFILDNFKDMHVAELLTKEQLEGPYKGFKHADPSYVCTQEELEGEDGSRYAEISNAFRLYPHRIGGEGHFVALLRKEADSDNTATESVASNSTYNGPATFLNSYDRKKNKDISDEAYDFLEKLGFEIRADRLVVRDDRLYMVPEGIPSLAGLRIMRCGLLLGEMKKGRFEPSQALASSLKAGEYDNVYNMTSDDENVIRYLKCESIASPDTAEDGFVLVMADGFPLGWGKKSKNNFKNKYLPGWRLM